MGIRRAAPIGIWILLLVASTTSVAAQGNEGRMATHTDWAMATAPVQSAPACFDLYELERYHPASPALLGDGARPGPTTCSYGDTPNSPLLSGGQALLYDLSQESPEGERAQARQDRTRPVSAQSYPTSLDWRRKDGQDWTTPVKEASTCGSCVAFAVVGSIESRLKIAAGDPSLNPDLAEAHLFFGSCDQCCDGGMTTDPAMVFARDTGIVDEACYPYSPQNQPFSPCAGWQSRTTAIEGWSVTFRADAMKEALAKGGPIVATLTLYEDFRSYSGGIYQHTYGESSGGHAVTLVGYDDAGGYWIGKNSWGTDWGEDKDGKPNGGGWFRIYYGEAGIDDLAYIPLVGVDREEANSMSLASGTGARLGSSPM